MSYFPKPSLNENDLAIIERGDTAAHSIEAGQYVSWHGKTGKAKAAILQGATLSDSLFDYDEDGVLNASLKVVFNEGPITTGTGGNDSFTIQENGTYLIIRHVYCGTSRERATAYIRVNGISIDEACLVINSTAELVKIVHLSIGDIVSFTNDSGIGHGSSNYDSASIVKIGV